MPMKSGKSSLFGKYGAAFQKAAEAHRNDEVEYGQFGELPSGIEGGIAQLVDCKFDVYKKGDMTGEYYFYAAGVVKSPVEHAGQRIEGLRTSIMEPVCDTPNRSREGIDEHVGWIQNELKKLGAEPKFLGASDIEATAAALKEAKPHFRFRTWKGQPTKEYPDPRTNHKWNGLVEFSTDGAPTDVVDSSSQAEEGESGGKFDEFGDIDSLVGKANANDQEAKDKLEELAVKVGYTKKEVNDAISWEAVAEMISGRKEEEEPEEEEERTEEPEEEEEVVEPAVEEIWVYKIKNPKTKKIQSVECEVTAVSKKNHTVTLKRLDTKAVIRDVDWDDITEVD